MLTKIDRKFIRRFCVAKATTNQFPFLIPQSQSHNHHIGNFVLYVFAFTSFHLSSSTLPTTPRPFLHSPIPRCHPKSNKIPKHKNPLAPDILLFSSSFCSKQTKSSPAAQAIIYISTVHFHHCSSPTQFQIYRTNISTRSHHRNNTIICLVSSLPLTHTLLFHSQVFSP